ncbi:MAG TPA: ribosome biogenesis GTP-binding protein YihA/YsxC, partial [Gammaproteobacteria bacterium]|nr:ribosome biogenesis GTP-binding protein YihA/YsxC [Gammaproteobacteria bacterium]
MNDTPEKPPCSINLRNTTFLKSATSLLLSPPDHGIEIAFVGRSNAGKSSALNAIVGQKTLARTSKTPGRTQMLNFFTIDKDRRFVDLPGYGYAKISEEVKEAIEHLLSEYLTQRQSLYGLIFLMDIRRPLTLYDRQFIDFVIQLDKP